MNDRRFIRVRGARTHNLANVDVDLPRDALVVITGPSGSGKSSLAFNTIFAEGQRRYVESLGVGARQGITQLPRPDVDLVEGLSPAVALEQSNRGRNPRSTVGTTTEIYDYLRLLFARVGVVHSHVSGRPMKRHTIEDMVAEIQALPAGTKFSVLARVADRQPGTHRERLEELSRQGYVRAAVDGELCDLEELGELAADQRHTIDVYVDRLVLKDGVRGRLVDSLEIALRLADGRARVLTLDGTELEFSERFADFEDGVSYPELTPRLFSFNSPDGACPTCDGLGSLHVFDPTKVVPDETRSLADGAVLPWRKRWLSLSQKQLAALARHYGFALDTPWRDLSDEVRIALLEGSGADLIVGLAKRPTAFEGVMPALRRKLREAGQKADDETSALDDLSGLQSRIVCRSCNGERLRLEARMVKVDGSTISELTTLPLDRLLERLEGIELAGEQREIAETVLERALQRLRFLCDLGLDYLTLDRSTMTLSGGEAQRIRLATQIGSALVGITYVLDEPSIGLHPRDNTKLISALHRLRDLGNSVLVVEHDAETIRAADYVVDMGPGAGRAGGRVVVSGSLDQVLTHPRSLTAAYMTGKMKVAWEGRTRRKRGASVTIRGARGHNLKGVTARLPVGALTCVTGVSGSGKSTLIMDTLLAEARRELNGAASRGLDHDGIDGLSHLEKVICIDQTPIGRSARSNPATYTGIFSELRTLFAQLNEAKIRGYTPARFSFNVKGGRCEECQGEGERRIEMHFLADIFVTCPACGGTRYNRDTLSVRYRGKSIADVLAMSVTEACDFLANYPALRPKLEVLRDVGLGYVALGQSAVSLSGGEAQRIKLARELAKKSSGDTLYILDEPTTGLHFHDVAQLLKVLHRLVEEGNTVVVIEHDLDVIASADHVIDVGPEGGAGGGEIVVTGTPARVAKTRASHTGRHLAEYLAARGDGAPSR
ncbi:MAG: excinuclease ABC subunit UvrA [Myxococcales bacterium FL481]|nr:MAG: excinuclease ABC subunit UvrA [Myxococcales bacterium FL481]